MDRRRFLVQSATGLAGLSLGLAGCVDDVTPARLDATPPPPQFPKLTFITCDPAFTDYRPTPDVTGTNILFERTPVGTTDTTIYIAKGIGSTCQAATPFMPVPANPPANFPTGQTRPDWSWVNGTVAFTGTSAGTNQVYTVGSAGGTPMLVPQTIGHIYPIWSSDGTKLVVYNDNPTNALPLPPVSSLIDPTTGDRFVKNLNGNDAAGVAVFGGFAAPQPGDPYQIAYAGQPEITGWSPPAPGQPAPTGPAYNQEYNYVFRNSGPVSNGVYSSVPLEPLANIATYDPRYQARAPYWSPNGQYVVFESNRPAGGGYALYLANVAAIAKGTATAVQITDPTYWANHAKFLPGGTKLVFTALQTPNALEVGPRGIAIIDISSYL